MKTNRFGVLVMTQIEGKARWELIPWHAIESITAFDDTLCVALADRAIWVVSPAPIARLETIFEERGSEQVEAAAESNDMLEEYQRMKRWMAGMQ